ncbi:ADP-ribosyl cyclase/cyclic ADP-ribose hydrolase 1-like [Acanthopagrus latus]|uniref:ADP-ribosyl cyclase/cyclic ADP-ribose hydrolase 1-like n=1 Tax=Acanthopagrus latus TaxID=8177 RepID=UPI00187CFA4D|nr:ADP-ribosyl cyclase/cyclic ADP-ribose hydrolase 1-like [Acanthopagrus latus]
MAHVFGSSWTVLLLVSITVMLLQSQAVQGNGCFYWLFSCFKPEPDKTVPNLKEDVLANCRTFVSGTDLARCNKFWDHFTAAFINKDPTTVRPEAYKDLIQSEPIPVKTEVLLWSKTSDMITWLSENDIHEHYFHIGETIYGSLDVPNAVWCGQKGKQVQ